MLRTRSLLAVLALPALALAQDAPPADVTGSLLWDALPPGADLVIDAPSLPRLLESAAGARFGTPAQWRAAFHRQLALWGEPLGKTEELTKAADALLALADGEALVAGMELPRLGSPTAPRTRCTVVAFRSSAKEPELRAQVDAIVASGLRARWPTEIHADRTMGRPVIALAGPYDGLWITVQDHVVAASDHPFGLGLLFRGIERVTKSPRPKEDLTAYRLRLRFGRDDAADKWEGTTFFGREAVSSPIPLASVDEAHAHAPGAVLSFVTNEPRDLPVFAWRLPEEIVAQGERMNARPLALRLGADGAWTVAGTGTGDGTPVVAVATRFGWLRAIAGGRLAPPFPSLDPAVLADVVAAEDASPAKGEAATYGWRLATDQPNEIRGPAWHGPVTFLALRTLHDIAHGFAPGTAAPSLEVEAPPKPTEPPPPPPAPAPSRSSDPDVAPKPGPALPAPEDK